MEIAYTPGFLRLLKSLPDDLRYEAREKIEQFRNPENHSVLKVHKLRGKLHGRYSFSVNYKTRIVFSYLGAKRKEALLLTIGDHDIYNA